MNENLPPSEIPPSPPSAPLLPDGMPPVPPRRQPSNFWGMFALGILLLVVSCVLSGMFNSVTPGMIGMGLAVISVFFRDYRGIFIGFVGTIGTLLLVSAIICGVMMAGVHLR